MRYASTTFDDSLIGSTLAGRYVIEARVGSGAMGAVYRAHQTGLARHVAVKILNRDRSLSGDTVQRFRREAQAMSALHHPNTVRVFDFGSTDDGLLFLAMELLQGESVTDLLTRTGALDVKDAVLLAQAVLRSVGEAHAHGIVHRDIKPDNVFLAQVQGEPAPVVKVLDFGIAKAIEGERKIDQFETLDGTVFGTPRYMSPEQAAGKALDSRSDLYAVGIMLFEFLAGRPPFVDSDAVVVMARHIREQPPPLSAAAPNAPIPPSLEAVVRKALAKDPATRWQTADEFDHALTACLADVEQLARLSRHGWHKSWLASVALAPRRLLWLSALVLLVAVSAALLARQWLGEFGAPRSLAEVAAGDTSTNRPPGETSAPGLVLPPAAPAAPESERASATRLGSARPTTPDPLEPPPDELASALARAAEGRRTKPSLASEPAATQRVVRIESTPRSAQVFRDGSQIGVTPLELKVRAGSPVMVLLRKRGFVDHSVELVPEDGRKKVTLLPLSAKSAAQVRRERRSKNQGPAITAKKPDPGTPASTSPYEKF